MESESNGSTPRKGMLRAFWDWMAEANPRLNTVASLSGIVGFFATVGLFPFVWHLFERKDHFVELYCPDSIRSHEYFVFGRFAGKAHQIRVYVGPNDGTAKYWILAPPYQSTATGQWSVKAHFGNPYGWDQLKELPLEYDVVAALVPADKLSTLPGSKRLVVQLEPGEDLADELEEFGIDRIERCTIRRDPEDCQNFARILSPELSATPGKYMDINSPVRIVWEPNVPMFVELWRGGEPLRGISHREWSNIQEVSLAPGVYQLKVGYKRGAECNAVLWFSVLLRRTTPAPSAPQQVPNPSK